MSAEDVNEGQRNLGPLLDEAREVLLALFEELGWMAQYLGPAPNLNSDLTWAYVHFIPQSRSVVRRQARLPNDGSSPCTYDEWDSLRRFFNRAVGAVHDAAGSEELGDGAGVLERVVGQLRCLEEQAGAEAEKCVPRLSDEASGDEHSTHQEHPLGSDAIASDAVWAKVVTQRARLKSMPEKILMVLRDAAERGDAVCGYARIGALIGKLPGCDARTEGTVNKHGGGLKDVGFLEEKGDELVITSLGREALRCHEAGQPVTSSHNHPHGDEPTVE